MHGGAGEWLEDLERKLQQAKTSGLHHLPGLLKTLTESMKLEAAGLKLLCFAGRALVCFAHPGSGGSSREPLSSLDQIVIRTGQLRSQGNRAVVPVTAGAAVLGTLWLQSGPAVPLPEAAELLDCGRLIGEAVATGEQQLAGITRQYALLEHRLRDCSSFEQLTRVICRQLFRERGVIGAVIRPLYGGTVLGRSFSYAIPGHRRTVASLQPLEESASPTLLGGALRPLLRPVAPGLNLPDDSPETLLLIPLQFGGHLVGVLCLFGGAWDSFAPGELSPWDAALLESVAEEIARAQERLNVQERYQSLARESDRKLQETTALFRIARALHSTLQLNPLGHLILSAAAAAGGGGFERALLFLLNERNGSLQGMLGVTRETAQLVIPRERGGDAWENPVLSSEVLRLQREAELTRQMLSLRFSLDEGGALAKAARLSRVVLVNTPGGEADRDCPFVSQLQLAPYACVPLRGKDRVFGVLVVDNPQSREEITTERLRFLELFAGQAEAALENALLLNRLENAHRDLVETQERLIQGERLAVLGEMSASVAHELRNPMVAIGGFAQRLERQAPEGSRLQEYAGIIARESRRMENMLGQILAFSKRQILCMGGCYLPEVIEEALEVSQALLNQQAVSVTQEIALELPNIVADQQKLRQVLINLIANACHAMVEGGQLWVRTRSALLRGDPAVEIEIEDTGGGIQPDVLRNIFNPFFTTKEQGTGLGLSISHRIIEHHRGEIEVFNTDLGARFTLRLPVRQNGHTVIDKEAGFG